MWIQPRPPPGSFVLQWGAESSEAVHSDNIKSDEDLAWIYSQLKANLQTQKACLLELYEYLLLDEHRLVLSTVPQV